MGRRKQSPGEGDSRLAQGRCPVHGLPMPPIDRWYQEGKGHSYTVVQCPRRAWAITAPAFAHNGPWALLPAWGFLLAQSETGRATILRFCGSRISVTLENICLRDDLFTLLVAR